LDFKMYRMIAVTKNGMQQIKPKSKKITALRILKHRRMPVR
jgi:hypothetical protein